MQQTFIFRMNTAHDSFNIKHIIYANEADAVF